MRSASVGCLGLGVAALFTYGCTAAFNDVVTPPDGGPDANPPPIGGEGGPDATLDHVAIPDSGTGDSNVPPVDAPADSSPPCNPLVADDTSGVFVAQNGVNGGSCGARTAPCATIGYGITQTSVLSNKTTVYVASGTYDEVLTLASGVGVVGGWNASGNTWEYACNAALVKVSSASADAVVMAANLTGTATLTTLTVANTRTAGPGESLFGIFATASMVVLNDVVVTVAAGGAGSPGSTAGTAGGTVPSPCAVGDGSAGTTPGAAGTAGPSGAYSEAMGFTAGGLAGSGGTGQGGADGTMGGAGTCESCTTSCVKDSTDNACLSTTGMCCGGAGTNGCAALPGTGGNGGTGGGSSVALFAWAGTATVTSGSLTAGNGGAGGSGAPGGSPGAATAGAIGTPRHYASGCPATAPCNAEDGGVAPAGAAGGTGGTASGGGGGGGGAGGDSYAYYAGGGAVVTTSGTPLDPGMGGAAGPGGGGGPAANGGVAGAPGASGPAGTGAAHN